MATSDRLLLKDRIADVIDKRRRTAGPDFSAARLADDLIDGPLAPYIALAETCRARSRLPWSGDFTDADIDLALDADDAFEQVAAALPSLDGE